MEITSKIEDIICRAVRRLSLSLMRVLVGGETLLCSNKSSLYPSFSGHNATHIILHKLLKGGREGYHKWVWLAFIVLTCWAFIKREELPISPFYCDIKKTFPLKENQTRIQFWCHFRFSGVTCAMPWKTLIRCVSNLVQWN
jgi:hypothetical protein